MFLKFNSKQTNVIKGNDNFINSDNLDHIINLDCVKFIDYAEATMEDLILAGMTAAEIAEKCDNFKIIFYFTDNTEMRFFAEKDFIEALIKELNVKSVNL